MGSSHGPVSSELEQARTAPEFGAHTSLSEKLLAVAIRAQNFTGSTGIAVALTEGDEMVCRANWGTSAPEVGARLSMEHSFTGLCVRTGEPVRCDDAQNDPRVNAEACRALGISAIAAAPIRRGLKVIGVLAAFSDTPNTFTEKHLLILKTLAEVIVEILNDPNPPKPLPKAGENATGALGEKKPDETQKPAATQVLAPVLQMPRPETGVTPVTSKAAATPAAAAPVSFEREGVSDMFEPAKSKAEPVLQPGRTKVSQTGTSRSVPMFGSLGLSQPETAESLVFRALHNEFGGSRRWLLPAAVFAVFAVIAAAGWRLHRTRPAAPLKPAAAATATTPVPTDAQAGQSTETPSQSSVEDAKHNSANPPPAASVVPAKLSPQPHVTEAAKPSASQPVETAKPVPAVVVPAAGPVRRLRVDNSKGTPQRPALPPQSSEPEPPQLAVVSVAALPALSQPVAASVGAPSSKVVAAQLKQRVEPSYPQVARRMRLSGTVVVLASITRDGKVGNVKWVRGNEIFRDSTVAAVKQWRYTPATLNGQATDSEVQISLQYKPPGQ